MNAQSLLNRVQEDTTNGTNTPISNQREEDKIFYFRNWFDELNNNFNVKDLSSANAKMLLNQNKYKYLHDEAMANTQIQRRVADLLKAGLNPYIANGLIGANGFAGEIPQSAANATSGENKQKLDWKSFAAQSGMNMLQNIISATMTGFSVYQTQKALMEAKQDAKDRKKQKDSGYNISEAMENGARGLRDGLMEMEKNIPSILSLLFGIPNFNFN